MANVEQTHEHDQHPEAAPALGPTDGDPAAARIRGSTATRGPPDPAGSPAAGSGVDRGAEEQVVEQPVGGVVVGFAQRVQQAVEGIFEGIVGEMIGGRIVEADDRRPETLGIGPVPAGAASGGCGGRGGGAAVGA